MYQETVPWTPNYDPAAIPPYSLPPLLECLDGTPVATAAEWREKRRPELLKLFRKWLYGEFPPLPDAVRRTVISEKRDARGGTAVRREIELEFRMNNGKTHSVVMLLHLPVSASAAHPVPVFVNLTFGGNQVITEEEVRPTGLKAPDDPPLAPGSQTRRYPIDAILQRGYALAVASYHDFFPDTPAGWPDSVYRLFHAEEELRTRLPNHTAIGAWAWGLSRMLDALEAVPEIDAAKAACIGHSRLGKASLWAGANDERFQLVCVNDSGCGGAALSRRLFGETLFSTFVRTGFGKYWLNDVVEAVAKTPEQLPVDQHELIALVVPRRVAVHSATQDLWADPEGEYLGAFHAGPVFRLLGKEPLAEETPPPPDTPAGSDVSYFLRTGGHDLLAADWAHYLDAADRIFHGKMKACEAERGAAGAAVP